MEFLYLVLEDMFSYSGTFVVDLSSPGLTRLVGKTGAGKSSIFNAVCQTLFDQNPTEEGKDRVINDVLGRGCWSGVGFTDDLGDVYHVSYSRGHKKLGTGHKLFRRKGEGWEDLSKDETKVTKVLIQKKLKYKYPNFAASVYLSQNQITHKFLVGTPSDRDSVFTDLMGLEFYDEAVKLASDKAKILRSDIVIVEVRLDTVKETLSSVDDVKEENLKLLETQLKDRVLEFQELEKLVETSRRYKEVEGVLKVQKEAWNSAEQRYREAQNNKDREELEYDRLCGVVEGLKEGIAEFVVDENEWEEASLQLESWKKSGEELRMEIKSLETEMRMIRDTKWIRKLEV